MKHFSPVLAVASLLSFAPTIHAGVITSGGTFTDTATSGIGTLPGRTGPGVNFGGGDVTVNGVLFQATGNTPNASTTLPNGVKVTLANVPNSFGANTVSSVTGTVAGLSDFVYGGGAQESVTFDNLTPGQTYTYASYNFSFGDNVASQGGRVETISDTDNVNSLTYDQNSTGGVGGNILLDTFTPAGSTFQIRFDLGSGNTGNSFHQYDAQLTAVPEPASLGVLGVGALGLFARRRKR